MRGESNDTERFVPNRISNFRKLTRENIFKFKIRVDNSATSILQTVGKYITGSSIGKHCGTSLYNFKSMLYLCIRTITASIIVLK